MVVLGVVACTAREAPCVDKRKLVRSVKTVRKRQSSLRTISRQEDRAYQIHEGTAHNYILLQMQSCGLARSNINCILKAWKIV
jgi:hypothetical protein